jgi:hypothetical protein
VGKNSFNGRNVERKLSMMPRKYTLDCIKYICPNDLLPVRKCSAAIRGWPKQVGFRLPQVVAGGGYLFCIKTCKKRENKGTKEKNKSER